MPSGSVSERRKLRVGDPFLLIAGLVMVAWSTRLGISMSSPFGSLVVGIFQ